MKIKLSGMRLWILPLSLVAVSCMDESGVEVTPPAGTKPAYGSFLVTLVKATDFSQANTSVLGSLFGGASPSPVTWEEASKSGACRLLKPRTPFCETPCGSAAACVEDNKCQDYPKPVSAGRVSVKGLKQASGAISFTMDAQANNYQVPAAIQLAFPPFAEGDSVTFSASGDSSASAFTISVLGISALEGLNDSLVLADGKPIKLAWTPPSKAGYSAVSVKVDISHHGGTKGIIECEGPDSGQLEIAAALVDKLKALGVSGFPKIEITRKAKSTNSGGHVDLVLESGIARGLTIPGLISCESDAGCPSGQTCQPDLRCE